MSLVSYRPSESPVAQMSVVAGLVASTAQALSLSFQEKSVLLRICQSFGSSVTYDVYRSVDGVVDSDPMVSGVSDALYLVGNSDTVTTIFVSEFNARVWFVLTLSHTSKKLSLISAGYATDVVRYSEGQNLTDTQKQQARTNIGVKSADELLEDAAFIAQLKTKLGIA